MLDRDQLEAFAAVLKFQSFERAAQHLNLTRGAISQRVRALEESLSRVLVIRGKPISATIHGEHLLRYVQALRVMEAETLITIGGGRPASRAIRIPLGVDADSMSTWFQDVLSDIANVMAVSFDLVVESPTTLADMLTRGELLGCISTLPMGPTGSSSDYLGALRYACVVEPRLAARAFPNGFELQRTLSVHAILLGRGESIHDEFLSKVLGFRVTNYPHHCFPTPEARLSAIRSGIGYGLVPEMQAKPLIQEGELVELLPGKTLDINLYWHQSIADSASFKQIRTRVNQHATEYLRRTESGERTETEEIGLLGDPMPFEFAPPIEV